MFEKNSLFYAANVEPEVARMARALEQGNRAAAEKFRLRVLAMVDEILARREFAAAGREEWYLFRNLVLGYETLDRLAQKAVLAFGKPFSEKFMRLL